MRAGALICVSNDTRGVFLIGSFSKVLRFFLFLVSISSFSPDPRVSCVSLTDNGDSSVTAARLTLGYEVTTALAVTAKKKTKNKT